jgi:GcrA cell cycle regulator
MSNQPWSEADVAKLRALAAKGMTSREIANELGEGFTRNSVIGKTQRMGIWLGESKRHEPEQLIEPEPVVESQPLPTATVYQLKTKTKFRPPPQGPLKPTGNQAFLMALTSNMCRFPVNGDGERTLFCGDPTEKGSWCPDHRKRVFYPKPGVKRDGEEVELRKESNGFLPDSGASSFRFGAKVK